MKEYYQLEGKCNCEVIVINTENKVILPIKKINIKFILILVSLTLDWVK